MNPGQSDLPDSSGCLSPCPTAKNKHQAPTTSAKTPVSTSRERLPTKRKLLSPPGTPQTASDDDEKKVTPKRKKGSVPPSTDTNQPVTGAVTPKTAPKTPNTPKVPHTPLSERQQLALVLQMTAGTDDQAVKGPLSPQNPPSSVKKPTPMDKKVNKRNERGETPLHIAAIRGDVKQSKKLIKAGAEVNVTDWAGWTPLHEACNHGWVPVTKCLIKAGAEVNVKGLDNDTPLHDASVNGHAKLVDLLVRHGANPHQSNSTGKTPLDVAASPRIASILRGEQHATSSDGSSQGDVRSPMSPDSIPSEKEEEHLEKPDSDDEGSSKKSTKSSTDKVGSPRLTIKFKSKDEASRKIGGSPPFASYSVVMDTGQENTQQQSVAAPPSGDILKRAEQVVGCSEGISNNAPETGITGLSTQYFPRQTVQEIKTTDKPEDVAKRHLETQSFSPAFSDISDSDTETDGKLPLLPIGNFGDMEKTANPAVKVTDESIDKREPVDINIDIDKEHILKTASSIGEKRKVDDNSDTESQSDSKKSKVVPQRFDSGTDVKPTSLKSSPLVESQESEPVVQKTFPQVKVPSPQEKVFPPQMKTSPPQGKTSPPHGKTSPPQGKISPPQGKTSPHQENVSSTLGEQTSFDVKAEQWTLGKLETPSLGEPVRDSERTGESSPKSDQDSVSSRGSRSSPKAMEFKDNRSMSPKVPPLKIIIPSRTSPSADKSSDGLKKLLMKPALPYVINPTQDGVQAEASSETDATAQQTQSSVTIADVAEMKDADEKAKSDDSKSDKSKDDDEKKKDQPQKSTRTLRSHTAAQQQVGGGPGDSQPANGDKNGSNNGQKTDAEMYIHPRKRKLRPRLELPPPSQEPALLPPVQLEQPENPFKLYLDIRKQVSEKRSQMYVVQPTAPSGYKDYLMVRGNYVLASKNASHLSVPQLSPPNSIEGPMRELFIDQEKARYKLRLQHLIEREKLILSIEQETIRVHGRAARAMANQAMPFSACTILKDEEIYSPQQLEPTELPEEKDPKTGRSRYNGRQFLSWIQDVEDKYERIKESLLMRHHHEAESLSAVQKMDWEWKLKELRLCDYKTTPVIDELHVPMVHVCDEFELLPT